MIEGTEGGGAVAADVADVAVDEEDDEEVDEGYDVEDGGTGKYCSRRISRSPITISNVRICIKKKKRRIMDMYQQTSKSHKEERETNLFKICVRA